VFLTMNPFLAKDMFSAFSTESFAMVIFVVRILGTM